MSERARALAERFERANRELIQTVERLSEAQWKTQTAGEGWGVNVVAHHVAESHKGIAGLVQRVASGGGSAPLPTMETVHERNAVHARQHADCTKPETLALLRQNGAAAAAIVRGLGDAELDRTAPLPLGTMSVAEVIERILIGHGHGHHGSIRQAIGA